MDDIGVPDAVIITDDYAAHDWQKPGFNADADTAEFRLWIGDCTVVSNFLACHIADCRVWQTPEVHGSDFVNQRFFVRVAPNYFLDESRAICMRRDVHLFLGIHPAHVGEDFIGKGALRR